MKFASRSAIESDSSAKAGSNVSNGNSEEAVPLAKPWPSLKDVLELGRNGVVGREEGRWRDWEIERLLLLFSILFRQIVGTVPP